MTDREREARIRERLAETRQGQLTLYTGCERAASDLDYLLARVERYREALEEIERLREIEEAAREALPLLSTFYRSYVPDIPEDRQLPTTIRRLRTALEADRGGQGDS